MDPKNNPTLPPQNTEAEASLLGALLIDSDAIVKVADIVNPEDFYDERHARIYEATLQLYEKHSPIDVLTLSDQLRNTGMLDMIGGPSYLTELTNFVPTAAHADRYAEIIAQKATRRRLIKASLSISTLGYDETQSLQELIESAETKLFEVSQQQIKQDISSIETILSASFDRLDELHKDKGKLRGIPTGYRDLDNILAGFQASDLIILAARPSIGKTALALNLAHNVAVGGKMPVLLFSLEMSKEQLVDRMLAAEAGVNAWNLRTGNLTDTDFEKIGQAMGTLSEAQIFIDDSPSITISDMRTKARREAHKNPLGLIIVDYLQLMSGGGKFGSESNRVQEISEISRGLKGIARELRVPVLALSQLSRSVESRPDKMPQLADLRESGCLTGDTLVYIPGNNEYVPIKELTSATHIRTEVFICSLNTNTSQLRRSLATHAFSTGTKPVYRLTTASGRTIRATANHKFLTENGWKRLDELDTSISIAVPRRQSILKADKNYDYIPKNSINSNIPCKEVNSTNLATTIRPSVTLTSSSDGIIWDAISSIRADGIEETFDLTVPGDHNFIANDIIVHNSIEQDADVVAFIFREDAYNPETENKNIARILVKKHRNGPVGDVDLYFDREKQRFHSIDKQHSQPFSE